MSFQKKDLKKVIETIEKETGLMFSFRESDLENIDITAVLNKNNTKELLDQLFGGTNLNYKLNGKFVTLIRRDNLPEQTISGKISENEETPIAFATISIVGTTIATETKDDGTFSITHPFSHDDVIEINYIGFEKEQILVSEILGKSDFQFQLSYPEVMIPYLVIKGYITDGINLDNNGSETVLDPNKIGLLAGQADIDLLAATQVLPGIKSPSSKASDIQIRGGLPDQNLILWEDIPLYHTAHYFGSITAIDPHTVKDLTIHRGGFGASYGGRVAGVIDIRSEDETSPESKIGIGTNSTHAYLYGLQKLFNDKTAVTFSLRRSFSELVESPRFQNITRVNQQGFILGNDDVDLDHIKITNDFYFIDGHFKVSSQINPKNKVSLSTLYSRNSFRDTIVNMVKRDKQTDSLGLTNFGMSFNYEHSWSEKLATTLKLVGTNYEFDSDYKFGGDDNNRVLEGVKENNIVDRQVTLSNALKLKNEGKVELGYNLTDYQVGFKVSEEYNEREPRKEDADAQLHSLFIDYVNPIQNKIGMNLGIRASYAEKYNEYLLEPRLRIAVPIFQNFNVSANYGRYHQLIAQKSIFKGSEIGLDLPIWDLADDRRVPVKERDFPIQEASLIQAGVVYTKSTWLFDVQAYGRLVDGISSSSYDLSMINSDEPTSEEDGSSLTKGIDILIKKRSGGWKSWMSYSYSKSDLRFNQILKKEFPSNFDQRHVIKWFNQFNHKDLNLSLGVQWSSALPFTLSDSYRESPGPPGPQNEFDLIYEEVNSDRLTPLFEINFSAQYLIRNSSNDYKTFLSFGINNVSNHKNVYNRYYYVDVRKGQDPEVKPLDKTSLRFTPDISIRMEF